MKKIMLMLALIIMSVSVAMAQTHVKGNVVSSEDGQPIIGATVMAKGTTVGVSTDIDGNFSLNVPSGVKTLVVSFVGMVSQEVAVKPNLHIVLESDSQILDDVMVVAFGTEKRSAFTGSAKVVDAGELAKSQVSSVTNALAGAVPGVQLTSSNGAPGSTSTIRVRGFGSLNANNDPLIIVDGAPFSGDLNNLNPADVESMTVLKDAASNALYGARGANGVIMITTKQAKKDGQAKVTFDAKYGVNTMALQHYDVITSPAMWYELQYAAINNYYMAGGMSEKDAWIKANNSLVYGKDADGNPGYRIWSVPEGQQLIGMNGKLNPNATLGNIVNYRGTDYLITPDDWEKVGTRDGNRQEYNVSISGAGEKFSYYMSLGYLNNQGITENSDMERLSGRIRTEYQAKKWLKVGANMAYTRFRYNSLSNNGSSTSTGNIWAFTSQIAPIYPIYLRNADGSIMVDSNGFQMMDYGDGMNAGMSRSFIQNANPIMDNKLNTNASEGNALAANAYADFILTKNLVLTVNGTVNLDETRSKWVGNPYYGQFDTTGGTVSVDHSRAYNFNLQQLLKYDATFAEKHNVNVMVGHEYYKVVNTYLGATKNKMFSQDIIELSNAVVDGQGAYSYRTFYNNEGWLSRAQYNYDEKYYISASYRRDASSRFHPDNRWGSFWSVGGAWRIAQEQWFHPSWVNELKLKASFGSQGNDGIGNYQYTDQYDVVNSNGNVGVSFASKGNKEITWESQSNFNTGVDFSLFNNRVVGTFEYYYRKTSDMLMSFNVAPSLGYSGFYDNVGDLHNTGFEFDVNVNILRRRNFNWDFHLNFAYLKNEIDMLHEDNKTSTYYDADGNAYDGFTSGSFFIAEGLPRYAWRLKEYAGVNEEGLATWYKTEYVQDSKGNDIEDENGHKTFKERVKTTDYSEADYYVNNETTIPPFFGGFGTTISAYGFDLSINCSYSLGGKTLDYGYQAFMANPSTSHQGYGFHKDVLNAWTKENQNSDIPRWNYNDTSASNTSTRFLTSKNYLNIENVNLGYTIPKKVTRHARIENVRVYVAAENLGYFSKRTGFDPRQSYGSGSDATSYSPMRTISGGISLQF